MRAPPTVDVMGLETEWITLVYTDGQQDKNFFSANYPAYEFLRHAVSRELYPLCFEPLKTNTKLFLANGMKIHFDTGGHLETATYESRGLRELLIADKVADWVAADTVARANEYWRQNKKNRRMRIFKANLDESGDLNNSCGSHDSYCVQRHDTLRHRKMVGALLPHLAARIFFTGNGRIDCSRGTIDYHVSQRARTIVGFMSGATTSGRTLINTKDESHANPEHFFRLHLISGDSVVADCATFLRMGTTALILEMFQRDFLKHAPVVVDNEEIFHQALWRYSGDSTLRATYQFGGKNLTAADVEEKYLLYAQEYVRRYYPFPQHEKAARGRYRELRLLLKLWGQVIDAARTSRPHEALSPFVDWAIKKLYVERDGERNGYRLGGSVGTPLRGVSGGVDVDPENSSGRRLPKTAGIRAAAIDLQFSENVPDGVMNKFIRRGLVYRLVDDEEVEPHKKMPPASCRSYGRSIYWRRFRDIAERRAMEGKETQLDADWIRLTLKDLASGDTVASTPVMSDPYEIKPWNLKKK